ncbi:WYL domain-containing protein [Sphingomonas qilianensis]|uniref:WYL domain-containing protein n=1 Tax=Sphingomonas qilianensis TaxID=1736690 RepID=UPI00360D8322
MLGGENPLDASRTIQTLVSWCEIRNDFRMFRLDRTIALSLTGKRFRPVPERSLAECLRQYETQFGPQI